MNTASKLAIAAAIAVVAFASLLISVRAQQPDYTTQCSNGVAVSDPQNNPGLVQDCAALLAARDAFAADPPLNWSPDTSIHDWEGITLESTLEGSYFRNRVVEIYLQNDGLTGSIPPELGNLANLGRLDLDYNQLTGSIPPELGNLTNLRDLEFSNNQLTGSIPPELGNLTNLQQLILSNNQLTGTIPPELGNLTNLYNLLLNDNQLTGSIPPELGNLTNLSGLFLSDNQLTGCIPLALSDVFYHDFGLLGLPLCDTADTTPTPTPPPPPRPTATPTPASTATPTAPTVPKPDYTAQCSNGVAVSDSQNNPGLVQDCAALLASKDTLAADPPLNWSADTSIHGWEGVSLRSTLVGTYYRNRVVRLELSHNRLTGSLPPELGNLDKLGFLIIRLNSQLSGSIPSELGNLINLEWLWLNNNHLTGSIPPELGNLGKLGRLYLNGNQLTGSIPSELGSLVHLWDLRLSDNQLTGCIPASLSDVSNHDFGSLGLPVCDVSSVPTPTPPPIATPTPAPTTTPAVPTVPTEVLNRLSALETVVASLEGRIAALEADAARPEPTPTPTLTPTSPPNTGQTPTATPIPSPTPQSVVEACVQAIQIAGAVSLVNGNWSGDCEASSPSPEGGVRYARFYTFTLSAPSSVTIDLTSDVDTHLYLREGEGRDGAVVGVNDDVDTDAGILDSRIQADLQPRAYSIEATTFRPQIAAAFQVILTIR